MKRYRTVTLVVGLAIVLLTGQAAWSTVEFKADGARAVHAVAVDAITELNLSDDEWTDLPGATTTIGVPRRMSALVIARWTGVSNPTSANNSGLRLRIMVGPAQAKPIDDGVYYATHIAVERSLAPVSPGSYVVKVQVRLAPCGGCTQDTNFSSSHFTVERIGL